MKKKKKVLISAGATLVAVLIIICWPEKKVSPPDNMLVLDTSKLENRDFYLSEETYAEEMQNIVEPYLNEYKVSGFFKGYDGEDIYYEQYMTDNEKGHIVVVHGFTDAIYKFHEVIYYFLQNGYSVSALEHRGHGNSYRAIDNLSKITVASFDEYIKDFGIFINTIVKPSLQENEKLFVYAHSMGGGIAARFMEEDNTVFDAAVLTSPMMEIEYGGLPNHAAELVIKTASLLGMEDSYILGSSDYEETYDFENSSLTSKARYDYIFHVCTQNKNYQMSGGDYNWITAAIQGTKEIKENAKRYDTDTLLFQAEKDSIVGSNGQNEFAAKASNVQPVLVKDAKHSILFTENETFIPYMNMILNFYEEHLN